MQKKKERVIVPKKEVVLKNTDYLILKPLNTFAAKKYGASTKWCTSSREPKTFYEYSENGILLYILSKIDTSKWAVYYDLKDKELSWWNAKDILTDGYLVDLPEQLKKDVLNYVLNETNPNSYYFDEKTKSLSLEELVNTPEMVIDIDGDNIDDLVAPSIPSNLSVVWPEGLNQTNTTTSADKIDSLVRKTLEYHYTISALNKGGEEIS